MRRDAALVLVLALSAWASACRPVERSPDASHASATTAVAPLTILQLNDVYSMTPVNGVGGLARVATLKKKTSAEGRTPFLILAGDFLSSSVESTVFQGAQMIAALNTAGLDLATLGNHEFDFGVDVLEQRMHEAKWQWVVSNVIDRATGQPVGGAAPFVIRSFGSLKVGFIGLCVTMDGISPSKVARLDLVDPLVAAGKYLPELRRAGVDAIIAVTHLSLDDDRRLAERFPEIDLIVGGHEHYPITTVVNRTLISKSGSDAKFVARIDVNRRESGTIERYHQMMPIDATLADDAQTAATVKSYEDRMGLELEAVVGSSRVPLDGVSEHLRTAETNLGDWVADAIRSDVQAEIAIVNSGAIRGDRVYVAGSLTRRTLTEMHPFGNVICKVAVSGRTVLEALQNGVAKLPAAAGQFPQISGLTFRLDSSATANDRVRDVKVGGKAIDLDRTYTVALPDYLLQGGDGYAMFARQQVLISPESGGLVVVALEKSLAAQGPVTAAVDGRILISR